MQTYGWKFVLFSLSTAINYFDYHFFSLSLSVLKQTDAESCSRFCGTGRPLCVLLRDRTPMRQERGWILSPCPTPSPPAHHHFLFIAWTESKAATRTGCNGNWNIMEHFCRLNWTLCPYHLLNRSQNRPTLYCLLRVHTHTPHTHTPHTHTHTHTHTRTHTYTCTHTSECWLTTLAGIKQSTSHCTLTHTPQTEIHIRVCILTLLQEF